MKTMDVMQTNAVNAANSNGIGKTSSAQKSPAKTETFSGMLRQYGKTPANTVSQSQTPDHSLTDTKQMTYPVKQNQIQPAKKLSVEETVQNNKDTVEDVTNRIVQTIAEDLNVDEQQIADAMETLGLTVMQLLQPQNLMELVQTITGTDNPAELLLNADFQLVMKDMSDLTGEILQQLDLGENQLDELVDAMQPAEEMQTVDVNPQEPDVLQNVSENQQMNQPDDSNVMENQNMTEEPVTEGMNEIHQESVSKNLPVDEIETDQSRETKTQTSVEIEVQDQPLDSIHEQTESGNPEMNQKKDESQMNENVLLNGAATSQIEPKNVFTVEKQDTTVHMNVIDMIEQIAEQTKVTLSQDVSTMEMQLKPENLGRVYLEVSTKEGAVRAQIAVQDEMVKEALQTQVATLQEKLNQAGVRVDAVEVTVASHQFEKNLEQDQKQQEDPNTDQNHSERRGRNLKLDELDGMNGLMTEEEQLAAQIMKDNGNSVDLTA